MIIVGRIGSANYDSVVIAGYEAQIGIHSSANESANVYAGLNR